MASEIEKNLGTVTAYGYAKSKGYAGTEEEFAELMASYASIAQQAAQSAQQAVEAALQAAGYATAAGTHASEAAQSAQAAQTATQGAEQAVQAAAAQAQNASQFAQSAEAAQTAAEAAQTAAEAAQTATEAAQTAAEAAQSAAGQSAQEAMQSAASANFVNYLPTDAASGLVAYFPDGAGDIPVADLTVQITPQQAGSGNPSPDNVRPISGWTGATITRTGKNLFDAQTLLSAPGWTEQDGVFIGGSTDLRNFIFFKNDSNYGGQLTISCDYFGSQTYRSGYLQFKYSDGTPNTYVGLTGTEKAHFALTSLEGHPVDEAFFLFSNSVTMRLSNVMLEFGATESGYETYAGKTIPVSWESEAGTVYGGTLDVTTGLLTSDWKLVNLTSADDFLMSSGLLQVEPRFTDRKKGSNYNLISNIAATGRFSDRVSCSWVSETNPRAYFLNIALEEIQQIATTTGVQICYELAEPTTYQLTPHQINTLLGVNNIWADTGDASVTYRADVALYINKKLGVSG